MILKIGCYSLNPKPETLNPKYNHNKEPPKIVYVILEAPIFSGFGALVRIPDISAAKRTCCW